MKINPRKRNKLALMILAETTQHVCILLDREHGKSHLPLNNYKRVVLLSSIQNSGLEVTMMGGEIFSIERAIRMYAAAMSLLPIVMQGNITNKQKRILSFSQAGRVVQQCGCFGLQLCASNREALYGNMLHHSKFNKKIHLQEEQMKNFKNFKNFKNLKNTKTKNQKNKNKKSSTNRRSRKDRNETNYYQLLQRFRFASIISTTLMMLHQQQRSKKLSMFTNTELPKIASKISLLASLHLQFHIWVR